MMRNISGMVYDKFGSKKVKADIDKHKGEINAAYTESGAADAAKEGDDSGE